MNIHVHTEAPFWEVISRSGTNVVRVDFYGMLLEATQGVFTWSTTDTILDLAEANGIEVLALISTHSSPNWANGGHGDFSLYPMLRPYYVEMCQKIVERYGTRIKYFEIANEPDISVFWPPTPNPVAFTPYLIDAYSAIKLISPTAIVMSPGCTGFPSNGSSHYGTSEFLQAIYDNGGGSYFDAVGTHMYNVSNKANPPDFSIIDDLQDVLDSNNQSSKSIYVTEIGFYTGTASQSVSESVQATRLKQLYDPIISGSYVDKIPFLCWYDFMDDGTTLSDSESNYGVIRNKNYIYPYFPKPAYYTYQQLAGIKQPLPTFFNTYSPNFYDYYDNFTRANGAIGNLTTGQAWTGSTWTISSNTAKNTPTLGSQLITNSDFATDTSGWTAVNSSLASVTGGVSGNCLEVTNVGANKGYAYQAVATTVGQWYYAEVKFKNGTSITNYRCGTSPGDNSYFQKNNSSVAWSGRAFYFRATTTTTYISLGTDTALDGYTIYYDDITIKQVTLSKIMCTVSTSYRDIDMSIENTNAQYSDNGLILNMDSTSNPQNFVLVTVNANNPYITLTKCVNGIYTIVYSTSITYVAGALVRVVKSGNSYQMYYNGVAKGTAQTISDIEIINNTIHGMWLPDLQASFDNFLLSSV